MSDSMKYNFGAIEGAAGSAARGEDEAAAEAFDLEETTLVPLNEVQEEMTKLGDASDLDRGEIGDGGVEHVDDWETPIV